MKLFRFQKNDGGLSRFGKMVSMAAVLLIALTAYLAASPEAHEHVHNDAGHEEHDCVVTAFAAGEGLYLAPQIEVRPTAIVVQRVHFVAGEVFRESFAYILPPVCGPPSRCIVA